MFAVSNITAVLYHFIGFWSTKRKALLCEPFAYLDGYLIFIFNAFSILVSSSHKPMTLIFTPASREAVVVVEPFCAITVVDALVFTVNELIIPWFFCWTVSWEPLTAVIVPLPCALWVLGGVTNT